MIDDLFHCYICYVERHCEIVPVCNTEASNGYQYFGTLDVDRFQNYVREYVNFKRINQRKPCSECARRITLPEYKKGIVHDDG